MTEFAQRIQQVRSLVFLGCCCDSIFLKKIFFLKKKKYLFEFLWLKTFDWLQAADCVIIAGGAGISADAGC